MESLPFYLALEIHFLALWSIYTAKDSKTRVSKYRTERIRGIFQWPINRNRLERNLIWNLENEDSLQFEQLLCVLFTQIRRMVCHFPAPINVWDEGG